MEKKSITPTGNIPPLPPPKQSSPPDAPLQPSSVDGIPANDDDQLDHDEQLPLLDTLTFQENYIQLNSMFSSGIFQILQRAFLQDDLQRMPGWVDQVLQLDTKVAAVQNIMVAFKTGTPPNLQTQRDHDSYIYQNVIEWWNKMTPVFDHVNVISRKAPLLREYLNIMKNPKPEDFLCLQ
ncbi:MAG: hypothetical protein LC540_19650 [Candidatus Thiodiazotropha sp.]|nr:hypothetical protein [Candidatus Thiodiazotropha sp.]